MHLVSSHGRRGRKGQLSFSNESPLALAGSLDSHGDSMATVLIS